MKIVLIIFTFDCLYILDTTQTEHQLRIKEGICIDWEKPNLNNNFNHLSTTLFI